jgi:autotransporter-associated beta strand protein
MNNDSKNNPCATGDILGDWREEMVLRTGDNANLRIYTTVATTEHRLYTLWHDHQYRNAMVWQCVGYNQPPHVSYFTGELEGITIAPPPLTMTGRTEVANGGTIGTDLNGKHAIVCENNDMSISIAEGASPRVMTFNVPSWVQGNTNNNGIKYTYYTHTVSGAGFTGNTRLVKQGDGILNLPKVDMTHTGNTDIWAGKVNFDGTMKNSSFWLNRFAELNSAGGQFRSIKMDYASVLRPGGKASKGEITVDTLDLNFGSIVEFDIYNTGFAADVIKAKHISTETKDWEYGPEYLTPVWRFNLQDGTELVEGEYLIAEAATIEGSLSDIKIEGMGGKKSSLKHEDGKIYLVIEGVRDASRVVWTGAESNVWNYAADQNFLYDGDASYFVQNDKVVFNDEAENFMVELTGELPSDTVLVDNSTAYTFSGAGAITGNATLVKSGTGKLTISTDNTYTGGNRISGGIVSVKSLSNADQTYGNLGAVTTNANKFIIENGGTLQTTAAVQMGSPIKLESEQGGAINNSHDFAMNKSFSGTTLTKKGSGWLKTYSTGASLNRMVIVSGTVENHSGIAAKVVELQGGALNDMVGTGNTINIPAGKKGTWTAANRQTYTNTITGAGTITIYSASEKGNGWYATRTPLRLNTSNFTGTIVPRASYADDGRFTLDIALALGKGAMDIPSDVYVQNSGKTSTVGQLTGSGKIGAGCTFANGVSVGANTWKIGNDEENFTWEGAFESNANFYKIGDCRMTVKGGNLHSGITRIEAGSILLSGAGAKLGTGTLTIASGATLTGTSGSGGSLNNSSVTVSGTVHPGSTATATSGNINFGDKNVTFNSGSTLVIGLRRCASKTNPGGTQIIGIDKLTMKGTISAFLYEAYEPVEGDSMIIFKANSFTGTPQFDLPELPGGYYWKTDRISEGLLFVGYDPTAIESIPADADVVVSVLTIGGSQIGSFTCPFGSVEAAFRQSAHPSGVYLLKITSPQGTITKKLLK